MTALASGAVCAAMREVRIVTVPLDPRTGLFDHGALRGYLADREVLRAMMGHTTEEMTQRYSGVPDAAKDLALETIFGELLAVF